MSDRQSYSKLQLQAMPPSELISIIHRYQEEQPPNTPNTQYFVWRFARKHASPQILFIVIGVLWIVYSNVRYTCPSGLCHIYEHENSESIGPVNINVEQDSVAEISEVIKAITSEFSSAAKGSVDKIQVRYEQLRETLVDLQDLYQSCQHTLDKLKTEQQMVLSGLSNQLDKCWCLDIAEAATLCPTSNKPIPSPSVNDTE